jgi:hypothetical protein
LPDFEFSDQVGGEGSAQPQNQEGVSDAVVSSALALDIDAVAGPVPR